MTGRFFPEQVAEHARSSPDSPAVESPQERLSYGALDARANRFAQHLRQLGVGPEEIVAVDLEPSVDWLVALLGIWKAGAAYLPLDPDLPPARRQRMLDDAGRPRVIT